MKAVVDVDLRREFWILVRAGSSVDAAAVSLGVNFSTGRRWFRNSGGMPPMSLAPPATNRYLTLAERERIHAGIHAKETIRQVAAAIGRHPSTVLREMRKNMDHQQYRSKASLDPTAGGRPISTPWKYSPSLAHRRGAVARRRPKQAKLATNLVLRAEVERRLELKQSPEQISARLSLRFPKDLEMRVSHETIYQSIYVQGRGALRRELAVCLRTGRALRKPQRVADQRRERIKDKVMISERPTDVEKREVPGDWEGDLITGKNNASAIGTLVERKTGFLILLHLPERHGALEVQEQMIKQMGQLPKFLRTSVTWDQGIEMSNHKTISTALDMKIYFCDPHSPWQRGTNENTNGLLRQYFPKGTDLSGYHADYLDFVANQLNDRPRKRHGFLTPKEVFPELVLGQPKSPGVATTS